MVAAVAPSLLVQAQAALWAQARQLASGWLTDSEQARLALMQTSKRREEFVACRYALRSLLATATATAVEQWRLDAPEGSAPRLNAPHHGAQAVSSAHLTLSHSGSYVACAVAADPVGVDIEVENPRSSRRDALAMAAVACSAFEAQQLHAMDCEASRRRTFVQWWSLKEAYFKCIGTGVDLSRIRRIECRRVVGEAIAQPLAHGKSRFGKTSGGQDVVLSTCSLCCSTLPRVFLSDENIAWYGWSDWALVEC